MSLDQSLAYIESVFEDYLRYGELCASDLQGKRVLELGPGDNFGVALRFLASGAEQVTCVDRFATPRDVNHQRRIYERLLSDLDGSARRLITDAVRLDDGISFDRQRLQPIEGIAVERIGDSFQPESFDLIVSRAVLEHLYDLDAAFDAMDHVLTPGGYMLHKVDFRDHGMFTFGGMHPLTFLTVPERLYHWMTHDSGRPNRHLVDWYCAKLAALGYQSRLLVTKLVGTAEFKPHPEYASVDLVKNPQAQNLVTSISPRLTSRFQMVSDKDLAIAGIFILARKPACRYE